MMNQNYTYRTEIDGFVSLLDANRKCLYMVHSEELDRTASNLDIDLESSDFETRHDAMVYCLTLIYEAMSEEEISY